MKQLLIDTVCWTLALLTVLVTRLVLPALDMTYAYLMQLIEEAAGPTPTPMPRLQPVAALPVTVIEAAPAKPKGATRSKSTGTTAKRTRRKASAKTSTAATA